MPIDQESTICAIATASGQGAISVIRLSGPETFKICDAISPKKKLSKQKSHTVHYCKIFDNDNVVDEVLISVFHSPNSYTGENVAEISCHGSIYIQQQIMELLLKHGAVLAKPGEFTMRAFMNGKMDLSQAEAVADLINSSSKTGHDAAIHQMRGGFSREIINLRGQLLNFASLVELELDFSEEDVKFADRNALKDNVLHIQEIIEKLIQSFSYGNVIKNGVPVAIVGKPNVGKSTLLNSLLNEEKAIVSEIPGTTRDAIEDYITIEGFLFRFIDTAGIRQSSDLIENLGIERTFENIKKASVVLLLVDANENAEFILKQIDEIKLDDEQHLAVLINKIDKAIEKDLDVRVKFLRKHSKYEVIKISAKKRENIQLIHQFLIKSVKEKVPSDNNMIVTNIRHYEALKNTYEAGQRVINGIETNLPSDLMAQDIREMLYHLGTITGEITTDEILGNIFKNFCIGK
jgi:tRNA modification GTPase